MRLEGDIYTLGLKLSTPIQTKGFDYYISISDPFGNAKTFSGVLQFSNTRTDIYERSSYVDFETIEFINIVNRDTAPNFVSIFLQDRLIGTWELKIGERLEFSDNKFTIGPTVINNYIGGNTSILKVVGVAGSSITDSTLINADVCQVSINGVVYNEGYDHTLPLYPITSDTLNFLDGTVMVGGENIIILYIKT